MVTKRKRHGLSKSKVHRCWRMMKYRCHNPNCESYFRYGGRGIKVCKRWLIFENFLKDMGQPPTSKHSIDRKNNALGYCKRNCRWATAHEQSQNLTNNNNMNFQGRKLSEREWARQLGLSRSTIRSRIRMGWTVKKTLSLPAGKYTVKV